MAILRLFFLCVLGNLLCGCYVTNLGIEQTKLILSRENVVDVIANESAPDAQITRLKQLQDILEYASREGLEVGDNYAKFIQLNRDVVSYLVYAAEPDKFQSINWWFPVVGTVPYLGFFEKLDRDSQEQKLASQGFDTHTGGATAFSLLGWLDDPIYSSMLNRSLASFCDLIFHELTHRTLWISGHPEFNERLASFVGRSMTIAYLTSKNNQKEIEHYLAIESDRRLYSAWLEKLKLALNEVYESDKPLSEKMIYKREVIDAHLSMAPDFKVANFTSGTWNNARILASSMYDELSADWEKAFRCQGNKVATFLRALEEAIESSESPSAALITLCS